MKPLNLLYDTTSLRAIVIDPENEQCTDQFSFQVTFRIDISLVLKATLMNDIITRTAHRREQLCLKSAHPMKWVDASNTEKQRTYIIHQWTCVLLFLEQ